MIICTDAPPGPLHELVPAECWVNEDQLISNRTIVRHYFESDAPAIRVTQISSMNQDDARRWLRDMADTLREIGYHVVVTAG